MKMIQFIISLVCFVVPFSTFALISDDLLSKEELEIHKKVKEKTFVWGRDEEPLEVQSQLVQPIRKFGTKEEESLGLDHD
jgi:hypothetical protein